MRVSLLENDRAVVRDAIREALEGAQSFDAAVAFVKRSGLAAAPALRDFARTNRLRLLAGTDFSQTEIEAVDDLARSGADSRVFVEGFARLRPPASARVFHPKIYLARRPDSVVAIVGSANLTHGGLSANHEACLRVEGSPDEPAILETVGLFETLWSNPYAIPVDDTFREEYRKIRSARERAASAYDESATARDAAAVLRAHLTTLVTSSAPRPGRLAGPRPWILVTSLANFEVCRERQWWGDIDPDRIGKLQDGDVVVFYIKGVKRLGGLALVRGRPFRLDSNPWPEGEYAYGIQVDFLLSPEITIDFPVLVPGLSFIENKAVWGTYLQGFMRTVPMSDFELMRKALAAATFGPGLLRAAES